MLEINDEFFMQRALELAQQAASIGEVPVGAVMVREGMIIAEGFNRREIDKNPIAHAEMIAISYAASQLDAWRLMDCTLYVTLEPCAMCAGGLVNARVSRLVFGCSDPKAGAVGSLMNICDDKRLNHRLSITKGVCAAEAAQLLKDFFASLRL